MALSEGETFAGYTIERLVGAGGMGEVYLARHPRLPRRDALKVLRADVSADDDFRARFVQEADLASALSHPNVVTVYDRGEFENQLWISTAYVDGTDAAELQGRRYPTGMPADEVASIVVTVASALDYAHEKGLLHRDVKPANILLGEPDRVGHRRTFLADFGIARPLGDPGGLTATNMTVGTVAYSAPEQLMGEPLDERADQYALAASAYHLLTGSQLYLHSNPVAVISRHLNAPVPTLADTRPDLAALDPVLAVALAKNRDDRFATCTDFADAFSEQASLSAGATYGMTRPAPALRTMRPPEEPETAIKPKSRRLLVPAIWTVAGVAVIAGSAALTLAAVDEGADAPTSASSAPQTPSARSEPTTSIPTTPSMPATQAPPVAAGDSPPPTTTSPTLTPTATPSTSPGVAFDAVCSYLHSRGDQWPDGAYLHRWMLERYPDLPPNQVDNILETAFQDAACQGPTSPPVVQQPSVSLEWACSDHNWRIANGAEGDRLCGAPYPYR